MSEATSELWDVRFSGGEIRSMTLEQMDAAYQADAIGEDTPVRAAGSQTWTTLGVAAGISNAPVAVAESAFTAPFSATAPFSPFAPSGTPFDGFSPVAPDAPSLRPLVFDLDAAEVDPAEVELDTSDADLESAFRPPPRNKKVAFAFGAVAVLFVFGLGANHLRKGSSAPAATLVAAAQPPSPPPASTIPPPALVAPLASAPRTSEPLAAPPPAKPSKKTKARSLRRK